MAKCPHCGANLDGEPTEEVTMGAATLQEIDQDLAGQVRDATQAFNSIVQRAREAGLRVDIKAELTQWVVLYVDVLRPIFKGE